MEQRKGECMHQIVSRPIRRRPLINTFPVFQRIKDAPSPIVLNICEAGEKGLGVFVDKYPIPKGAFVCKYPGELITGSEGKKRDAELGNSTTVSYMYFFFLDKWLW